jgi:hypothetical protein
MQLLKCSLEMCAYLEAMPVERLAKNHLRLQRALKVTITRMLQLRLPDIQTSSIVIAGNGTQRFQNWAFFPPTGENRAREDPHAPQFTGCDRSY